MNNVEKHFFRGNMRTSYELARAENTPEVLAFLTLFEKHGLQLLPKSCGANIQQNEETASEHYTEEDNVLMIRAIKEEQAFQQEIEQLEQLAKSGKNEEKAASFFTQGYLFLYAHHYDESVHCFREAVRHKPNNAVYAGICGQTLFRLNVSPFEALAYLEHAVQLQSSNARWYWNRALILMQLYKDLNKEEFLDSAIYELQLAKENCRHEQQSLLSGIQTTEQEIGQLLAGGY